ncbi:sugar O-acyltransferase (sialic acid O-acetyltransferase NeuD family) [Lentzea atacamensis]|uniref:Sugar O-acyltransferase (Sialic acid O-acetyltransferase NeuD family) n=2 Tax=Lentzea TaxID=165301 RepID=A0ABX9E929_9PSEU|nr:acetyltransferase [Lentzea atacamensis]RAS66216.1 sugar O-acyltransferase (sialic acid O-acetyltransferase NeuD family) [Lentzea atacamensis]
MIPRPLLLVGAGGLAREVLAAVRLLPDVWNPVGALDDTAALHGTLIDGVPVLGGLAQLPALLENEHPDAAVVCCVANARRPLSRLNLVSRLGLPDERWATVVHPAAVTSGASLGAGTVLLAGVVITTPLSVGRHVVAMPHVLITHDDEVSDGVTFAGRASLGGGVFVGESAYLGQGALVREGVKIGAGAVVGMGAVVLQDVPAGQTWAGVPARPLRGESA